MHLGIADRVGSLEVGKDGDVVVADGDIMVSDTQVLTVFLNGQRGVGCFLFCPKQFVNVL